MIIKLENIPREGRSDRDWLKAAFDMAEPGDTISIPPGQYDLGLKGCRPATSLAGFPRLSPA
jgi:hypothetical protein